MPMKTYSSFLLIVFSAIGVSGCAMTAVNVDRSERLAYKSDLNQKKNEFYFDSTLRVISIGHRLLSVPANKASADCVVYFPIVVADASKVLRESYPEVPENSLMVIGRLPGLAPASLDLRRGDLLTAVEGQAVSSEKETLRVMRNSQALRSGNVRLTFRRNDLEWTETVPLYMIERELNFIVDGRTSDLQAYTDARSWIVITTQMLRFAKTDDELAFILAHEIGHVMKGHWLKGAANNTVGRTAGATLGDALNDYAPGLGNAAGVLTQAFLTAPYSKVMEYEADEFALGLMKRSGFDPEKGPLFMRRFAVEVPVSQKSNMLSSHPAGPDRMIAMQEKLKAGDYAL